MRHSSSGLNRQDVFRELSRSDQMPKKSLIQAVRASKPCYALHEQCRQVRITDCGELKARRHPWAIHGKDHVAKTQCVRMYGRFDIPDPFRAAPAQCSLADVVTAKKARSPGCIEKIRTLECESWKH